MSVPTVQIGLLTNKVSRGSIAPWEGSIELGQQIPSTSTWLTSLEAEYEPNQHLEVDSEHISMDILAMARFDVNAEAEAEASNNTLAVVAMQNPLGISTGVIASATGSNLSWREIISTSLRWIAMVFLAVVLLIPAGCSYASRLVVGTRSRASPPQGRRRSNENVSSAISRAIANVATR